MRKFNSNVLAAAGLDPASRAQMAGAALGLSTGLPLAVAQTVLRDLGWLAEVAERRTVSTIERAGSDSRALPGRRLQG